MKVRQKIKSVFSNRKIQQAVVIPVNQLINLNLLLLAVTLVLRIFFFATLYAGHQIASSDAWTVLSGILYDVMFILYLNVWAVLPFALLYNFFPRVAKGTYIGLIALYAITYLALIEYFSNMMKPLDHILYMYPLHELVDVVFSSVSFSAGSFIAWIMVLLAIAAVIGLWRKVKLNNWLAMSLMAVSILVYIALDWRENIITEKHHKTRTAYNLAVNQFTYTACKLANYSNELQYFDAQTIREAATVYHSLFPGFTYLNPDYPFYRLADDADVLGGLLHQTTDGLPPDFVFFIVEGLGQRLTGTATPSVSFTPFIDSLAQEGLYWKNCLATTERTFGVLPSVFASAPYGKRGFVNKYISPTPRHNSLLKDMAKNGYTTSFYYGGAPSFDGQDEFLRLNGVSWFAGKPDASSAGNSYDSIIRAQHRWGLDDKETFDMAVKRKTEQPDNRPYTDIFLTLTTHEPFLFPEIEHYRKKVQDKIAGLRFATQEEEQDIRNNIDLFACFLYLDDGMRAVMDYYKTLPDYRNTIFVILGDHHVNALLKGSSIRRYHIPFIIYSPLIKESRCFEGTISQLDITPSLNAYLKANYNYQTDSACHWIGTAFDTSTLFRCNKRMAFMWNNRDVKEFLKDTTFLSGDRLYRVETDLSLTPSESSSAKEMQRCLEAFQILSIYGVNHDKLLPLSPSGNDANEK